MLAQSFSWSTLISYNMIHRGRGYDKY
ncbi:hypothetical protein LINGRAHAP2_LOCUS29864 [Linum grandiflorum]